MIPSPTTRTQPEDDKQNIIEERQRARRLKAEQLRKEIEHKVLTEEKKRDEERNSIFFVETIKFPLVGAEINPIFTRQHSCRNI